MGGDPFKDTSGPRLEHPHQAHERDRPHHRPPHQWQRQLGGLLLRFYPWFPYSSHDLHRLVSVQGRDLQGLLCFSREGRGTNYCCCGGREQSLNWSVQVKIESRFLFDHSKLEVIVIWV